MNDYYSAMIRSISGLDVSDIEKRREVYRLAREGLVAQLRRHLPPIPEIEIARECNALEAAAQKIEAEADRGQLADVAPGTQKTVQSISTPAEELKPAGRAAEADPDQVILLEFLKALELEGQHDRWSNVAEHVTHRNRADSPLAFIYLIFGLLQFPAFLSGLEQWVGVSSIASAGIFAAFFLLGSLGSIPMSIVTFYGAWQTWHWPIWGAVALALPFVVLSFVCFRSGGIYTLVAKLWRA